MPDRSLYLLPNNVAHKRSTEFLGSQRFAEFLNHMREEMDFIIIDGPAAKGRADAEVLARRADFSLLVVKQNYTKVPYINDTIDMLDRYGHGLAGCVFNDVLVSGAVFSSGYGYGYGYGKYRYGKYHGYGKYHSYYYNRADEEQENGRSGKGKKPGIRADRYYRDTVGLFAHFPQNVGMGSDLHNSWSGTVVCAGETAVSAGLYGIGNIYDKYTERTAGRCGYGLYIFL